MSFARYFESEELSDVTVVFVSDASPSAPRPAKRTRSSSGRSMPGHAVVLAAASERFAAEISRWQQKHAQPQVTLNVDEQEISLAKQVTH